jgi:hypothetical protein
MQSATEQKKDTSFEKKTKKSVLKNKNTLNQMTFPDFCRALIEISCLTPLSKKRKGKKLNKIPIDEENKVDAVQDLLNNIELISSNAERIINTHHKTPKSSKNKSKNTMQRRHSLGYLLALSQKLEKEKERKEKEKLDLKTKEIEKKEREKRGEEARKRVIVGLRKRKKEKLEKEKAFYAQVEKEKEKERRKSEFTNWITKRKEEEEEDGK